MEERLRRLLLDRAEDVPPNLDLPAGFESRARRRIALTVGATVATVVVLALGAGLGLKSLLTAPPPVPADRGATPSPSPMTTVKPAKSIYSTAELTIAVPKGWEGIWRGGDERVVGPDATSERVGVVVSSDTRLPAPDCDGPRASAEQIVRWILADPGLEATPPTLIHVGGLSGVQLDVVAASGATPPPCARFASEFPVVTVHEYGIGRHAWGVTPEERMRVFLLDLPRLTAEARTLAILVVAPKASFDRIVAQVQIVETSAFDAGQAGGSS